MVASHNITGQFRILFEAAPNGIMILDMVGRIIQVNAQIEKMFGYARTELIGESVEILVPVRFRRRHIELRKNFVATSQTRLMGSGCDLVGVRKDGSEFPVEIGLNLTATGLGEMVVATIVDIRGRKRIADKNDLFDNSRKRLQVCQQLGMPAAVLQQDARVVAMNPLFKELHSQFLLRGGKIQVMDPTENELFKQELASLDNRNLDEIVYSRAIPASHDYPPLIFHLLPMESSFGDKFGILVVMTLDGSGVPSADLAQKLFALTPAEARVAVLISSGVSPHRAADKLGISEGNVRTTLKHVFAKVGISRQSELAALLTKLALRRSATTDLLNHRPQRCANDSLNCAPIAYTFGTSSQMVGDGERQL